jgi:UDP-glucose 4-epimerase
MKVLITGAAGGIGSTLGHQLHEKGYQLILVDNFRNGYEENLVVDGKIFGEFFEIDINSVHFENLVKNEKPDVIVHLAAITALPDCEVNFKECIRVNVEGTASVLGAASKHGVKKVIFSSTSAVYENSIMKDKGFEENDEINPKLFYSLSKKMAEELCNSFRENYGLNVYTLRFFNVFGPKQDIHRKNPPVINYITKEFFYGRKPILHSDGLQKRDYVHIDDVVNIIEIFINTEPKNGHIYNLSSGEMLSLREIVHCIKSSNEKFKLIEEFYRDSDKLWDYYPELFEGEFPLKKNVIEKETNKKSLGNNKKITEMGYSFKKNIKELIKTTSIEIQKNLNNKNLK